jgi:putative CocE/NonD family hydrolase
MNNDDLAFHTAVRRDFPCEVRREVHTVPMRDGTRLSIKLWLPSGELRERSGVVLEAIPYRKDDVSLIDDETRFAYFAGCGIAGARLDLRGSGSSTGILTDEYTPLEQADIVEVIGWLAVQPWCNGSVGMMGISWSGFNALQVAARRPAPLKAIITACSSDDRYDNDVHYHGGVPLAFYMNLWGSALELMNMRPPRAAEMGAEWIGEWVSRLQANPDLTATWLAHPYRDGYWRQGSVSEDYSAIECAVLAVGGWADAYTDTVLRLLDNLDAPTEAVIGPWGHTWPERPEPGPGIDFLGRCVRWWDRWLHGVEGEPDPRVSFYVQSYTPSREDLTVRPGRWLAASDLRSLVATAEFPLGQGGMLGVAAPAGSTVDISTDALVGLDARHYLPMGVSTDLPPAQDGDDASSACFDTPTLREPVTLLGNAALRARLRVDAPSGQVFVRVTDVDPDGHSHLVARGGLNLTHRDGHAPADVHRLEPGVWENVEIPLKSTAYRFEVGHRIRVALSSVYWPWLWPAPDRATVTLDLAASALVVPQLPEHSREVGPIDLGDPEIAPPPEVEVSGQATPYWEIDREPDGAATVRRGYRGQTHTTLADGWTFGTVRDASEYFYRPSDPSSARMTRDMVQRFAWDEHEVLISLSSTMTGDRDRFTVATRSEATLDGAQVFGDVRVREIPRGL